MQTAERRRAIEQLLRTSKEPVTGNQLAAAFQVSRQVIVQDMAVLRAGGLEVEASAQGYSLRTPRERCACVVACRHTGKEEMRRELYAVADVGACVEDIVVEHPVYGEIVGRLRIGTRQEADQLVESLSQPEAAPLSVVTGGLHLHTLTASHQKALDQAIAVLKSQGVLVELTE